MRKVNFRANKKKFSLPCMLDFPQWKKGDDTCLLHWEVVKLHALILVKPLKGSVWELLLTKILRNPC